MSTRQLQLGDEIEHKGGMWRVVRIIISDHSLFEDHAGTYVISESYIQVKSPDGEIDFVTMSTEKLEYTGEPSTIKAIDPLLWRKP